MSAPIRLPALEDEFQSRDAEAIGAAGRLDRLNAFYHHLGGFPMMTKRVAQAVRFLDRQRPGPERRGHRVAQANGPPMRLFDDLESVHRRQLQLPGDYDTVPPEKQQFARDALTKIKPELH
ncbi:MAG: hypothetical protein ACHP7N_01510 [Caulobacterales bacterium]